MDKDKEYTLDFSDPKKLGLVKSIPLTSVQSVEIKKDNRGVYVAGKGYNSIFGYTPSTCIYLFDVLLGKITGTPHKYNLSYLRYYKRL